VSLKCSRCRSREPLSPYRQCERCLNHKRSYRLKMKLNSPPKKCRRCYRDAIPNRCYCARCYSSRRLRSTGGSGHDLRAHAKMVILAHHPRSRCYRTGITLHVLARIGQSLWIDRINPNLGYTTTNMQLLASSLNQAKGVQKEVPLDAVKRLMRRIDRLAYESYSSRKAAFPT